MKKNINAIFISDIHLGNRYSDVETLNKIFDLYAPEKVYLVGDILDITSMERKVKWNKHATTFIRKILRWSKKKDIFYIYGNHDHHFGIWKNAKFHKIKIKESILHTTKQGVKYLVIHGHQFDGFFMSKMNWLYYLGDYAYEFSIKISKINNKIRKWFRLKEFSLSLYLKKKIKSIISFISDWENMATNLATLRNCHGIICGHIHNADEKYINGVHYLNCGCCTEYVSFIIEDEDGEMKLVYLKK